MSLFKKFFGTGNDSSDEESQNDLNNKPANLSLLPVDEKFTYNFKKNGGYLLLHPSYSEGISIYGADQLHILEPINNLSKRDRITFFDKFNSLEHLLNYLIYYIYVPVKSSNDFQSIL